MKHILNVFLLAALVFFGTVQAKPLEFNDETFDYSDSDLETAYITLQNVDGALKFNLSSLSSTNDVATIDVTDEVVGYDTDSSSTVFWQESYYRTQSDAANVLSAVTLDYRGNQFEGVTLVHGNQLYEVIKMSYLKQLEALGFTLELIASDANVDVYTIQVSDGSLRMVFSHQGNGTQVNFS
jgi:hypothetical protein